MTHVIPLPDHLSAVKPGERVCIAGTEYVVVRVTGGGLQIRATGLWGWLLWRLGK